MVIDFRSTISYDILGNPFQFKTDRNYSVYEVTPRTYTSEDGVEHDVLSVVRGRNPLYARESLERNIYIWDGY